MDFAANGNPVATSRTDAREPPKRENPQVIYYMLLFLRLIHAEFKCEITTAILYKLHRGAQVWVAHFSARSLDRAVRIASCLTGASRSRTGRSHGPSPPGAPGMATADTTNDSAEEPGCRYCRYCRYCRTLHLSLRVEDLFSRVAWTLRSQPPTTGSELEQCSLFARMPLARQITHDATDSERPLEEILLLVRLDRAVGGGLGGACEHETLGLLLR